MLPPPPLGAAPRPTPKARRQATSKSKPTASRASSTSRSNPLAKARTQRAQAIVHTPKRQAPPRQASHHRPNYNDDDTFDRLLNPEIVTDPPPLPHEVVARDPSSLGRVYVATSRIPTAGKGDFAATSFPTRTLISEYSGVEHLTWRQITDPTYKSDYAFADKKTNIARDAFDPVLQRVTCAAGYANDPLIKDAANCELITLKGKVFLRATRPIRQHEELLVNYGQLYWQDLRWDLSLLRRAAEAYRVPKTKAQWQDLLDEKDRLQQATHTSISSVSDSTPPTPYVLQDPFVQHPLDNPRHLRIIPDRTDFRCSSWNIDGNPLRKDVLTRIKQFFTRSNSSCLFLQDARTTKTALALFKLAIADDLPTVRVRHFATTLSGTGPASTQPMGGTIALVHEAWDHLISAQRADHSGLGLIAKLTFNVRPPPKAPPNTPSTKFHAISAYIPPPQTGPSKLWQRLSTFLSTSTSRTLTPRQYLDNVISAWTISRRFQWSDGRSPRTP